MAKDFISALPILMKSLTDDNKKKTIKSVFKFDKTDKANVEQNGHVTNTIIKPNDNSYVEKPVVICTNGSGSAQIRDGSQGNHHISSDGTYFSSISLNIARQIAMRLSPFSIFKFLRSSKAISSISCDKFWEQKAIFDTKKFNLENKEDEMAQLGIDGKSTNQLMRYYRITIYMLQHNISKSNLNDKSQVSRVEKFVARIYPKIVVRRLPKELAVFIKVNDADIAMVHIKDSFSIEKVKIAYFNCKNISKRDIKLMHGQKILDDDKHVYDYDIIENSILIIL